MTSSQNILEVTGQKYQIARTYSYRKYSLAPEGLN